MSSYRKGPPTTERYCRSCEEVTEWKYDRNVFHSRCTICNCSFSIRPENVEKILGKKIEDEGMKDGNNNKQA